MIWLVAMVAVVVGLMFLARNPRPAASPPVDLRRHRSRTLAPAERLKRASRLRRGIDVPRQWHPFRPTATGDLWVLGAGAALLAERERSERRADTPGLGTSSDSIDYAADDSDDRAITDDFSGHGGSSGGAGASGDWTSDDSGSGGDFGGGSSDGGGD